MIVRREECKEAATRLQMIMESKNIGCYKLARATGLSVGSIYNYMRGLHNPYTNNAVRICSYLGCKVNDIWKDYELIGSSAKHGVSTVADVEIAKAGYVKDVEGSTDDEIFYLKEDTVNCIYICVTMTRDTHGEWTCIHETYLEDSDELVSSRMDLQELHAFYDKIQELQNGEDK